jgi:hypothetical protein
LQLVILVYQFEIGVNRGRGGGEREVDGSPVFGGIDWYHEAAKVTKSRRFSRILRVLRVFVMKQPPA